MLANMDHPHEAFWTWVGENMPEVRRNALWPDCDSAAEFLEPDLAPILAQRSWEEFQMPQNAEPFVQVKLDVLFYCSP